MANTREIKTRMDGIRDTQKITNAMYLIASTKMRKAKAELDKTKPYFTALQEEIKRIFRIDEAVKSRYFYPPDGSHITEGTYGCLVITADKGLAGAYNQNVIKEAGRLLKQHADTKLFVVGEHGRQFFPSTMFLSNAVLYTAQNPTMQRAQEISRHLLEMFDRGELKKIFIVFTDFKNGLATEAVSTRLLPFHRKQFATDSHEKAVSSPFEFFPAIEDVLNGVMESYVSGFIYSALVDSFCSEQNARMTAMDAANKNAEHMLADLSVQYNRIRQAVITQEITEVSSGAKAQKRKRRKEASEE